MNCSCQDKLLRHHDSVSSRNQMQGVGYFAKWFTFAMFAFCACAVNRVASRPMNC